MADNPYDQFDEPTEQAAAPSEGGGGNPYDQFDGGEGGEEGNPYDRFDDEKPLPTSSAAGALIRRGLIEAPVGAVAGAAGVAAAPFGAAAGTLVAPGPGTFIGGLATGVPAAMAAGGLAKRGEDWLLDKLGLKQQDNWSGTDFFTTAQEMADKIEHPWASTGGEIAGQTLPAFGMGGAGNTIGQQVATRGTGAALNAGIEGGQQVAEGEFDPARLVMNAAAGAIAPTPRGWANAAARPGEQLAQSWLQRWQNRAQAQPQAQGGGNEGLPPPAQDGEVIPPETPPGTGGPGEVVGLGDHLPPIDAEFTDLGPIPTSADMSRANDVTAQGLGTSPSNSPAPHIQDAGNPVGAPMAARDNARPNDPDRNYTKGLPAPSNENSVTTGDHAPDIMAAMQGAMEHPATPTGLADLTLDPNRPARPANAEGPTPLVPRQPDPQVPDAPRNPEYDHPLERLSSGLEKIMPDEVERARFVREASERAHQSLADRARETQTFEEPGRGTLNPDRPARSAADQARDVTATETLSPEEHGAVEQVRKLFGENGWDTALKHLNKLKPRDQYEMARRSLDHAKKADAQDRERDTRATTPLGKQTGGGERHVRKTGALEAVQNAVKEFPRQANEVDIPTTAKDKALLKSRLQAMVEHGRVAFGSDPTNRTTGYRPNEKPAFYQVYTAAQRAVKTMNPRAIQEFRAAEKAYLENDEELARANQYDRHIEADIAMQPSLGEKGAEARISQAAATREKTREHHDYIDNHDNAISPAEHVKHRALVDWLNTLSEEDYAALARDNEISTDVKATHNPFGLQLQYASELAAEHAREGKGPVFAEDKPKAVAKPAPEEKAAPGRKIDKNSPEWKAIAERALNTQPKKNTYDLAHELEQQSQTPLNGKDEIKDMFRRFAEDNRGEVSLPGSWEGASKLLQGFLRDESGAVRVPAWLRDRWDSFVSPERDPAIIDYGEQLGRGFLKVGNRITEGKSRLLVNAIDAAAKKLTLPELGIVYRAAENGSTALLPPRLRQFYNDNVAPIKATYDRIYDAHRTQARLLNLPEANLLPARTSNGNGYKEFVPRMQKGNKEWDGAEDHMDPLTGNTLGRHAETLLARDWFALQNSRTGERIIYKPGDGSYITRMTNGSPSRIRTTSNSFNSTEVGSTLNMNRRGRQDTWTVDHATIDEITQHAGTNAQGQRVQYHDNPVLTYTNAVEGLLHASERLKMYAEIVNSPEFQNGTTRSPTVAKENGWIESNLPQFSGVYMPKHWAWAMNDFVKGGFTLKDTSIEGMKTKLNRVMSAFPKIFYTFGPIVHGLNIGNDAIIGRGFRWITPQGTSSLVRNGLKALKAATSKGQDPIVHDFIEAGGNPMMMHTMTRDLMPRVARMMGQDIATNAAKWNPVRLAFGLTNKQFVRGVYDASSKIMWWMSDAAAYQRFLEEREIGNSSLKDQVTGRRRGMSDVEAAKKTHDFVASYHIPTTVGKSIGIANTDLGRIAQQFVTSPSVALFGRYHYDLIHVLAKMGKGLVAGRDLNARIEAAGQITVAAGMLFLVYPLLSEGYQKLTGSEHAEVEPRGSTRILRTLIKRAKGEAGNDAVLRNVWTPSVPVSTVADFWRNRDFAGREIVEKGASAKNQVVEHLDYAARSLISPFGQVSNAAVRPGATLGSVAKSFGESVLGIREPSPGEVKFKARQEAIENRDHRQRLKRPRGVIEKYLLD